MLKPSRLRRRMLNVTTRLRDERREINRIVTYAAVHRSVECVTVTELEGVIARAEQVSKELKVEFFAF